MLIFNCRRNTKIKRLPPDTQSLKMKKGIQYSLMLKKSPRNHTMFKAIPIHVVNTWNFSVLL